MTNREYVVLVNEKNRRVGVAAKDNVHTTNTPLHRGFSLFVFNSRAQLLITKRAQAKKTFPGVWTNTVCGHPGPGESAVHAAKRRLRDELSMEARDIRIISPYRYQFADQNGIVENEICPILVGYSSQQPDPNDNELDEWIWIHWHTFLSDISKQPDKYSPWSREEAWLVEKKLHVHED